MVVTKSMCIPMAKIYCINYTTRDYLYRNFFLDANITTKEVDTVEPFTITKERDAINRVLNILSDDESLLEELIMEFQDMLEIVEMNRKKFERRLAECDT